MLEAVQQSIGMGILIMVLAFFAEYVDSTLGMGYGTSLTPILLLFGYQPLHVVPAILLSELLTGILAGVVHHAIGNVDFKSKTTSLKHITSKLKQLGLVECARLGLSEHLRIALVLALCSIVGIVLSVIIALNLPAFYVKLYIGILVTIVGAAILITMNKTFVFSWSRIVGLSLIASFNKGISGGGYGPVVTGGQLLSGVESRNAIGITSMAEGLTCMVGFGVYLLSSSTINLGLAPLLVTGALLSVPFSALTVKCVRTGALKSVIGIVTVSLGLMVIVKMAL